MKKGSQLKFAAVPARCLAGLMTGVVLLTSACGPSDEELTRLAEAERLNSHAVELWSQDVRLVSEPVVIDDLVLGYVLDGEQLALTAWNAQTGAQKWKHLALAGAGLGGINLVVNTLEYEGRDYVSFIAPLKKFPGQLIVVDVATGEAFGIQDETPYWVDPPSVCAKSFCTQGFNVDDYNSIDADYQFNWDTGVWDRVNPTQLEVPLEHDARYLGENVSANSARGKNKEILSYGKNHKFLWTRPYEEIFGRGYTSDSGWAWISVGDERKLLLGAARRPFNSEGDEKYYLSADLAANHQVVALDEKTGETVWRLPGALMNCPGQPFPKPMEIHTVMVFCVFQPPLEIKSVARSDEEAKASKHAWYAVGVDTSNGEVMWQQRLLDLDTFMNFSGPEFSILPSKNTVFLALETSLAAIDTLTGEVREVNETIKDLTICTGWRKSQLIRRISAGLEPWWDGWEEETNVLADYVEPCDRDSMKPTDKIPNYGEFLRTGYFSEDSKLAVLPQQDRLVVYGIPPLPATP